MSLRQAVAADVATLARIRAEAFSTRPEWIARQVGYQMVGSSVRYYLGPVRRRTSRVRGDRRTHRGRPG